jgi:hypothetical protein
VVLHDTSAEGCQIELVDHEPDLLDWVVTGLRRVRQQQQKTSFGI